MKLRVFEKDMCCSTGYCNDDTPPELIRLSRAFESLQKNHVCVKRYQPRNAPAMFSDITDINLYINEHGLEGLPVISVGEKIVWTGRYPTNEELSDYFKISVDDLDMPPKKGALINFLNGLTGCGCFDGSCRK